MGDTNRLVDPEKTIQSRLHARVVMLLRLSVLIPQHDRYRVDTVSISC
jgi:hypothetical protein